MCHFAVVYPYLQSLRSVPVLLRCRQAIHKVSTRPVQGDCQTRQRTRCVCVCVLQHQLRVAPQATICSGDGHRRLPVGLVKIEGQLDLWVGHMMRWRGEQPRLPLELEILAGLWLLSRSRAWQCRRMRAAGGQVPGSRRRRSIWATRRPSQPDRCARPPPHVGRALRGAQERSQWSWGLLGAGLRVYVYTCGYMHTHACLSEV